MGTYRRLPRSADTGEVRRSVILNRARLRTPTPLSIAESARVRSGLPGTPLVARRTGADHSYVAEGPIRVRARLATDAIPGTGASERKRSGAYRRSCASRTTPHGGLATRRDRESLPKGNSKDVAGGNEVVIRDAVGLAPARRMKYPAGPRGPDGRNDRQLAALSIFRMVNRLMQTSGRVTNYCSADQ
jgi:hypothetical protein